MTTTTIPNETPRFTLFGNLGNDPKEHTTPARTVTQFVYDEIIDDPVEREFTFPERNFLTYSVATGGFKDKPLRWIYCFDEEGLAFRARQGDRLKLEGYFETRTYTNDDGEEKTIRQLVVESCQIVRIKVRSEVA